MLAYIDIYSTSFYDLVCAIATAVLLLGVLLKVNNLERNTLTICVLIINLLVFLAFLLCEDLFLLKSPELCEECDAPLYSQLINRFGQCPQILTHYIMISLYFKKSMYFNSVLKSTS